MSTQISGRFRPFSTELSSLNRILDAALIWVSLYISCVIFPIDPVYKDIYQYATLLAIIFYFLLAEVRAVYRSSRLEGYGQITEKILTTWLIVSMALIAMAFATKTSANFSRLTIGTWLVSTPILLVLERICLYAFLRFARSKGGNTRTFVVLGDGESPGYLLEKIQLMPWAGLSHEGSYHDLEHLLGEIKLKHIDYVFLTYSGNQKQEILDAINALANSTATVYLAPNIFLADLLGSHWVTVGNIPMITINDHPFYGGQWVLKKIEDLILGILIFVLILPVMMVIALAIKLTSRGPILFKQRRYGLNGEIIQVLKFRTMTTQDDGAVVVQASKNDPRITPFGRFLRRTSLDELPQFVNVLQGTMSIVGPRPHAISHNEQYRQLIQGYMLRHKVKPGITGWAQVNGLRGETETVDKMKARVDYDLYYINHWSIWLDLKIIFLTIINGFTGKSAY